MRLVSGKDILIKVQAHPLKPEIPNIYPLLIHRLELKNYLKQIALSPQKKFMLKLDSFKRFFQ
jgi:hypothetical protein